VLDSHFLPVRDTPCETTVVIAGNACPGHSVSIARDSCEGVPIISTVTDSRGRFAVNVTALRGSQDFYARDDQLPGSANCRPVGYTLPFQLLAPSELDAVWVGADMFRVTGVVDPTLSLDIVLAQDSTCRDDRSPTRLHRDPGTDGGFEITLTSNGGIGLSATVESAGRCTSLCATTSVHDPIPDAGPPDAVDGG